MKLPKTLSQKMRISDRYAFLILLLPLLLFLPGLNGFPYSTPDALFSDIAISHYPNAIFLRRSLIESGQIPLWSPQILSGYPFVANPLAGLWYLPGWLALLLPLPLGFNLLVMLHLLWGGLGMLRLLQQEGLSRSAALLGAVAFLGMPKLFAHYGAGHLTLLYAIPWTPWLLLVRRRRSVAIVLALIFVADPRWAVYAGLLLLAYSQYVLLHSDHNCQQQHSWLLRESFWFRNSLLSIGLAAMLAAPLALPLLEYTRLSTRASLTGADIFTQSLPPVRLLGLLYPEFGGAHEWMLYVGAGVLVLGIVAQFLRIGRFWAGVLAVSLLFSLGDSLPLVPALTYLPGFDLLRVPPRALFVTGMAAAALAAYAVDRLQHGNLNPARVRSVTLALMTLTAFSGMFALAVGWATGQWTLNFLWGAVAILCASLWVGAYLRGALPTPIWIAGLLFLVILDTGAVNASVLNFQPAEKVIPNLVVEFLANQPGDYRAFSPSYSLPQQSAALYGLHLADGVDPLQLRGYAEYMAQASGTPSQGYSVTLPPFLSGDLSHANAVFIPDAKKLGLLSVRYLAAEFDLNAAGLQLVEQFGTTRIYENLLVMPPAWVITNSSRAPAEIIKLTPNEIIVRAAGPGLLVLSEIAYPGWQVYVDGERSEIKTYADILRSIPLGGGSHLVRFIFHPWSVYFGLMLCAIGLLIVGVRARWDLGRNP